jgi:TorA maturation chaperone TorD
MTKLDHAVREKLREAAEWRLLGQLFELPSPEWRIRVRALAAEIADGELRGAARMALEQAEEGLYHSAFGPGGPAPPREAAHRDTLQLGYLISELEAFYGSFGYDPKLASFEPPDHVSVEAGFVAYLKFKEAYALALEDQEAAAAAADACAEFLGEHLASIASPLEGMLASSGVPYLEKAGRILSRRTGPAKPRFLVLGGDSPARDGKDFCCESEELSL